MSIIVSKTVKIGHKDFLNDVIGRKKIDVIRNKTFYSLRSKNEVRKESIGEKAKITYAYLRTPSHNSYGLKFGNSNSFIM